MKFLLEMVRWSISFSVFNVKAEGHTKKAAQQKAAYNALILLKEQGVDINPKGKR